MSKLAKIQPLLGAWMWRLSAVAGDAVGKRDVAVPATKQDFDPAFGEALLREGIETMLVGDKRSRSDEDRLDGTWRMPIRLAGRYHGPRSAGHLVGQSDRGQLPRPALQRCLTAVGGVTDDLLGEDATECCEHDRRQRNPRAMEPRLIIAIDAHAVRKAIDVQPGTVIAAEFA